MVGTASVRRPPAPMLLALLAALVVTAASCESGGSDPATGATVPTEWSTTAPSTTSAEESLAIPDDPADIDVAYANRVSAARKRITGDLVRKVVATRPSNRRISWRCGRPTPTRRSRVGLRVSSTS